MNIVYKEESFKIIGCCMAVHSHLGSGFLEVVYKEALEHELKMKNIQFDREKKFEINYKDVILPHKFLADFVVFDKIILELKSVKYINDAHIAQAINYLKVSSLKLALIVNFGEESLTYQRIVI